MNSMKLVAGILVAVTLSAAFAQSMTNDSLNKGRSMIRTTEKSGVSNTMIDGEVQKIDKEQGKKLCCVTVKSRTSGCLR